MVLLCQEHRVDGCCYTTGMAVERHGCAKGMPSSADIGEWLQDRLVDHLMHAYCGQHECTGVSMFESMMFVKPVIR